MATGGRGHQGWDSKPTTLPALGKCVRVCVFIAREAGDRPDFMLSLS